MEANEMPERVYLFDYNDAMVTPLEGDTTYVREEAFIEKAKKWFEKQPEQYDANGVRCYGMEDFKDFRKYMKGDKV